MRLAVTYTRLNGWEPSLDGHLEIDGFPRPLWERIQRFRRAEDRKIRMAVYRLLHAALIGCGLGPKPLDGLRWDSLGRPFLATLRNADFNLSHSGDLAVCALAWGGRVGVDVERIREVEPTGFESYFPASEWRRIASARNSHEAFFDGWTRLESVVKGEGFGLAGPVGAIEFSETAARVNGRHWSLFRIDAGPGYCCHAAVWPAPEAISVEKQEGMPVHV